MTRSATVNLLFPGQYYDSESGLHYNWNRYYDPATGRYVSSDPIGLAGGLNTFGYVGANPVMYIDPDGFAAQFILGAAGACARNGLCRSGALWAGRKIGEMCTGILNNESSDENKEEEVDGEKKDHGYKQKPKNLEAYPDAKPDKPKSNKQGGGGKRPRWKDSKGKIYEWDSKKGTVEVYDKTGKKHLGEFDPVTGKEVGPRVQGRTTPK